MPAKNIIAKLTADTNVSIKPKYFLNLFIYSVLSVCDRIPRDVNEAEKALSLLKEKSPKAYPLISSVWNQIKNDEIEDQLSKASLISKSEFLKRNRMAVFHAILSDDNLSDSNSEPALAEFLKHFAISVGEGKIESIFDPAFGLGTLIFTAFSGSKGPDTEQGIDESGDEVEVTRLLAKKIYGNEVNETLIDIANTLGKLAGFDTEINLKNSLDLSNISSSKYQLVVSEPPAGMRLDEKYLKQDWKFGRPSKISADWAWAQIVQKHIAIGGYGLLFVTSGALFRSNPNEVLIRAKMVSAGSIKAVFNLPSGMSPAHRANMSLIIFSHEPKTLKDEKILFVDMAEPEGRRGTFEYTKNLFTGIHDACDVFEDFINGYTEKEIGYTAVLDINDPELMKNDMNLNPSLYVTQVVTGVDTKLSVKKDVNQINKRVIELTKLAHEAEQNLSTFSVKAEFLNLGDLITNNKVIQIVGMSKNEFKDNQIGGVKYNADSGDRIEMDDNAELAIQYISVEDIRRPGDLLQTGMLRPDIVKKNNDLVLTQPGDVVFIKTGKPAAKVDRTGNKALFSPLSALRITDEGRKTISPEVLAFVLNGERVKKFMQGTTVGRLQIELIPIPIMDSLNIKDINDGLYLVQRLLMKSLELNKELHNLEQKLNQVLAGEFDGLQEER